MQIAENVPTIAFFKFKLSVEKFEFFGSQNGAKRTLKTDFICLQLNFKGIN